VTGLIAFLRARLDEDEAAAQKAASGDGRFGGRAHWSALGHGIVTDVADPDWGVVDLGPYIDDDALAEHIARHDPARALRDVEAKRAMIAELTRWPFDYRPEADDATRLFVRLLGSVYSDHPDYLPEWAP
jgi:hypothetical protein